MKTLCLISLIVVWAAGSALAQELISTNRVTTNAVTAKPVAWVMERDIPMQPPAVSSEAWKAARHGVLLQFLEAPNPLAPLNPFTPVPPRFQDSTLSRDHLTGRIMGLTLVKFEF
jgi:hypothetical protein